MSNYKLAKINFLVARSSTAMCKLEDEITPVSTNIRFYYPNYNQHVNLIIIDFIDEIGEIMKRKIPLFVYTYHDELINFTGHMIGNSESDKDIFIKNNVKVFLYDNGQIIESIFNDIGVLENWPFGWFLPSF